MVEHAVLECILSVLLTSEDIVISHYCKLEEKDLVELGLEIIVGVFSTTRKVKKCSHYEYRILIAYICSVNCL